MAVFAMPPVLLAPIFGTIADLHGRKWILIFGLAVYGIAGTAAGFASSFETLLAFRALQGIGVSAIMPLTIVLISDLLPDERELGGQGLKVVLDRVGMIILPIAGGALTAVSWRLAFAPFALAVPLAVLAFFCMPETAVLKPSGLRQYLIETVTAVREPRLYVAFGTGFLRFFLDYGLYTYLPLLLTLRYAASATSTGVIVAMSAAGAIVTAMSIGRIHRFLPPRRFLAGAFAVSALSLATMALDCPLWVMAVAAFAFGLANGVISPLQKSLLTRRTVPNLRGGVVAVDRIIQQIAKSLAPVLMGALLLVADVPTVRWALCGFSVIGAVLLGANEA